MKKTAQLLILVIPLILISCFEFVGTGTSKRMLNLFLAAPADVAKIHVAVFDGALTPDRVIYKESFAAGSNIPFEVPAGNNRIIVVWAEGFSGSANYFGSIGPVTIDENGSTPLPIQMKSFSSAFNLTYSIGTFSWNSIPGAISNEIEFITTCLVTVCPQKTTNIIAFGNTADVVVSGSMISRRIRVLSSVFDLGSVWSN